MILMANAMMGAAGYQAAGGSGIISAEQTYITNSFFGGSTGFVRTVSTITGCNIGVPHAERDIYAVAATFPGEQKRLITAMTIGGVSAELLLRHQPTHTDKWDPSLTFWKARVPTGTLVDVVTTAAGETQLVGPLVVLSRVIGSTGVHDTSTGWISNTSGTLDLSLNATQGGMILAAAFERNGSGWSWSGLAGSHQVDMSTDEYGSIAWDYDVASTGMKSITATNTTGLFAAGAAISVY